MTASATAVEKTRVLFLCTHNWSLPDPSRADGAEKERMRVFRSVRDRLKGLVEGELANGKGG